MTIGKRLIGRRTVVGGIAAATLAAPGIVNAQGTYPNKTIRYINPFPAGGPPTRCRACSAPR